MITKFAGAAGKPLKIEALLNQTIVAGNRDLAEALAACVELKSVNPGELLIEQGAMDNDIYLIFAGAFNVVLNDEIVACRRANEYVGEIAALEPSLRRSANVVAIEESVVARLSEANLVSLGNRFSEIYRCIAKELALRLSSSD